MSFRRTKEGRKNLVYIHIHAFEILRRFAPLNDKILYLLQLQSQLFRNFQHPLDRLYGFLCYFSIYRYFRPFILQGIIKLFKRIQAHVVTFIARTSAVFWRNRNEVLFRALLAHLMKDTTFSSDDKVLFRAVYGMF